MKAENIFWKDKVCIFETILKIYCFISILIFNIIYKATHKNIASKIASLSIENDKTNHSMSSNLKIISHSKFETKNLNNDFKSNQNTVYSKYNAKGIFILWLLN